MSVTDVLVVLSINSAVTEDAKLLLEPWQDVHVPELPGEPVLFPPGPEELDVRTTVNPAIVNNEVIPSIFLCFIIKF